MNKFNARTFRLFVQEEFDFQFEIISPFVNIGAPISVKCSRCFYEFSELPYNISLGELSCTRCDRVSRKSAVDVSSKLKELVGDTIVPVSEYVNSSVKMKFLHRHCGRYFMETSSRLFGKPVCPLCDMENRESGSLGEIAVMQALRSLGLSFEREKIFQGIGARRFDFFIPSLNIAIEYDGEQHFKAVDHWGGEEALKRTQESDALKNDFCEYMGIDLLRIPYWEFDNIDEIVTNFIDTVKLMRSISANSSEMAKC